MKDLLLQENDYKIKTANNKKRFIIIRKQKKTQNSATVNRFIITKIQESKDLQFLNCDKNKLRKTEKRKSLILSERVTRFGRSWLSLGA